MDILYSLLNYFCNFLHDIKFPRLMTISPDCLADVLQVRLVEIIDMSSAEEDRKEGGDVWQQFVQCCHAGHAGTDGK